MSQHHIRVCRGRVCGDNSERIMDSLNQHFNTAPGKKTDAADLDYCGCLGGCEKGPNVEADGKMYHHSKPDTIVGRIERSEGVTLSEIDIDSILADDELFDF